MTNSSGFGQTEENRVKDAANYARTSNDIRNSTEANKYLTAATARTQSTTESDPPRLTMGPMLYPASRDEMTPITDFQPSQPMEGSGDAWATDPNAEGGTGNLTSETDDLKTTYFSDQSFGDQALLNELTNLQNVFNMEKRAELDRVNNQLYTGLDIERGQAFAAENRLGQRVQGEEDRAEIAEEGSQERGTLRVRGQEERGNIAEEGTQRRALRRVEGAETRGETAESGQQDRATSRVTGQEERAGMAEQGSQTRGTRRVEGQEVRETDLQREMFRRYKESRDYDQAQRGARSY